MRLTVFGATGKTGLLVCKQALEQGHAVTAYVRDPAKLDLLADQASANELSVRVGSLEDKEAICEAVTGPISSRFAPAD